VALAILAQQEQVHRAVAMAAVTPTGSLLLPDQLILVGVEAAVVVALALPTMMVLLVDQVLL
jgi:hypothetical protein